MAHTKGKDSEGRPVLHVTPEGWIDTIKFDAGLWLCGEAVDGMSVQLESELGSGVFTNDDLRAIKSFINAHLRVVKKRGSAK